MIIISLWGCIFVQERSDAISRDRFGGRSTATTPLGHLLAFGTHHAAGATGPVPSGTSRYYSVDFGLVHFIALDLNMYQLCS